MCIRDRYYCALAKREQIPFSVQLDLPECLPVDEIDLCLVLSNLLENALEASLRTAPARRRIELTACLHGNSLALIQVENTYDGVIREKGGVFQSCLLYTSLVWNMYLVRKCPILPPLPHKIHIPYKHPSFLFKTYHDILYLSLIHI